MKITKTQMFDVNNPELVIRYNFDTNKTSIVLTYTCPKCGGHGCGQYTACDSSIVLEPGEVLSTCGFTTRSPLADIFKRILEAG